METDVRKDYMIKNCGCGGTNVWRVHEVEYYKDSRGNERQRVGSHLTPKMTKPQAEQRLEQYRKGQ